MLNFVIAYENYEIPLEHFRFDRIVLCVRFSTVHIHICYWPHFLLESQFSVRLQFMHEQAHTHTPIHTRSERKRKSERNKEKNVTTIRDFSANLWFTLWRTLFFASPNNTHSHRICGIHENRMWMWMSLLCTFIIMLWACRSHYANADFQKEILTNYTALFFCFPVFFSGQQCVCVRW